jgi:pimeloyl-ACP methyl ester carboxylesterase/class 3 adenylate cyclase
MPSSGKCHRRVKSGQDGVPDCLDPDGPGVQARPVSSAIHYALNGDISIAYRTIGDGPVDLVFIQGNITNLDILWDDHGYRGFCEALAGFSRLILFDKRGMGLSDRVETGTMEDRMDDVRAVLDAVGSERAVVMGVSEGGLLATLFAAAHPERTASLVLLGSEVREEKDESWPWGEFSRPEFEALMADWSRWGEGDGFAKRAPSLADADAEQARTWWARLQLHAGNPRSIEAFSRASFGTDTRAILPSIHVPTLVVHRTDDRAVDVHNGRYLAEHIAGARYTELPGIDHIPWISDPAEILSEIQEFVTGSRPVVEIDRVLATVLFTDVVGSTARAAEMGDRAWGDLLAEHHAAVRAELARFRGEEVATAGDGFLAMFDGPARAVRCALASVRAVRRVGLDIRAGLHTGEVIRAAGEPGGLAVHIGSRVAALAGPGEVLASSTVKDLVAGSELHFADRGLHRLKGVPDRWRIYQVE